VVIEAQLQSIVLAELGQRLSPLRLCEPEADARIGRSLADRGQLSAVVAFVDGDKLELVDGFKRFRAAQKLGWSSLQVRVLPVGEVVATAVIALLHEQQRLTELEQGWLIRSLCREHGLTQGAAAQLLRRHKSWVSRRLLLVEGLDDAVQGDVRLGLLSPRSAVAIAALPRGNQRQAAVLVSKRGLTTRQTESLVHKLCELKSDEARRECMVHWPEEVSAPQSRRAPPSDSEQLRADIAKLMQLGVRLQVRLYEMRLPEQGADVVYEALVELVGMLDALRTVVARALAYKEPIDATLEKPPGAGASSRDAAARRSERSRHRSVARRQPQHRAEDSA
jgi:ParB/RepB/Spo0J family partition protein